MAKGIIGTKLGMTQLFDQESGRVTPVTVIEAGPCPVVAVRTPEADGYTAVQLAFGAVKEKKLTRPRAGHLKAAGVAPHRHAGRVPGRRRAGTSATPSPWSRSSRASRSRSRRLQRQGLRRHDQAPPLPRGPVSHGSHNVRAPGSIGASATPSHVFKGTQDGGPDGLAAGHPARPARRRGRRRANLLLVEGAVPGATGGIVEIRSDALMAAPTAPVITGGAKVKLDRGRVRTGAKRRARARGREGRAGRAPAGHVVDQDPRPRRGRARQAVAPEGHRPRPRRHHPGAALDRRRRRVRPASAQLHRQGQPQGAVEGASHRALRATRWPESLHVVDGVGLRRAEDRPRRRAAADRRACDAARDRRRPGEEHLGKSFRNLERTHVVDVGELEVADVVWARSLVVSKAALGVLEGGEGS